MHTLPPGNDEEPEYPPQRPRRASLPPRQQPRYKFPPVEHSERPEIPKVRRASRLEQPSSRTPIEIDEEEATGEETHTDHRTSTPRTTRTTRTGRTSPTTGYHSTPTSPQTTNKFMVQQKKRTSSVYTPPAQSRAQKPPATPPPAHRIQRAIPKRSWQQQFIHITRSRSFIPITTFLVLVVLFSAIIANISRSQTNSVGSFATPANPFNVTPQTGIQSGNPHELVITPQDTDHPPPPVYATSAYLLDANTGATLYAHNPFMHLPMMSTTKLMTALLAVEQGKLDQPITINSAIANDISHLSADSTVFGLKKGETYTLQDMLYALLLPSGNDAAIAIADTLGGNQQHFVDEMNQRARQLGLYDTHYMNPHGLLQTGQYSSARDLAILGRYVLNIPIIHKISGTETYDIPKTSQHPDHPVLNGNQFLFWYPGVDGGKPGYDGASNFVQVISVTRNGHHLIGVTMHTNNWWTDMRDLMNWGFDNFTWVSPHDLDSMQNPIPYDYLWNYFASDKKENTITTADGRYYIYTGYIVSDPILSYFDLAGGLQHFGYPVSLQIATSSTAISQHFEKSTIQCDLATKQCTTT